MKRVSNFEFRIPSFAFPPLLPVGVGLLLLSCALWCVPCQAPAVAGLAALQAESTSVLEQADAILREMSRTTGLPIKAPLKKQIVGRPEVQKYLVENLHAEYTPREIHIQEATLQAFGLVSRDFDLEKFLVTFYTEQAAGFYDPRRKTMFLAEWVSEDMQKLVLAHELTHALQDQNFDMDKFLHAARDNDDATGARQAVVEGHATAAMMQHLIEPMDLANLPSLAPMMAQVVHQRFEEFPAFSNAPFFFRLQALFPYVQGMGFMQRALTQSGWKKLNTLFTNPPLTTKEIFEPQVYFEHRPLPKVSLPRPAPLAEISGLSVLSENVMGELGYYALLGQFISEDEAKSVGTAWLGDRYILYEGPGAEQYALVARTRWSSPESALAFFRDYHTILARKYPELAPDQRSTSELFMGSAASGHVILVRKGDECLWAEGIPVAQANAMISWLRSL